MKVLVIGEKGLLAQNLIRRLEKGLENKFLEFTVVNSTEFNIRNKICVDEYFDKNNDFDFVINCSAYTNVSNTNADVVKCYCINSLGCKYLAENCKKYSMKLIHISTDYVYDATKNIKCDESMALDYIKNYYGESKREGELKIINTMSDFYILRTSTLYGHNYYSEITNNKKSFVTKIVEKLMLNEKCFVTDKHFLSPTNVDTLINVIIYILCHDIPYGIYNVSDEGCTTNYRIAKYIEKLMHKHNLIKKGLVSYSDIYRPFYAYMSKKKIKQYVSIPKWKKSLKKYLKEEGIIK